MTGPEGREKAAARLLQGLLALYPPRFRREFSGEIRAILAQRLQEAEQQGGAAWLAAVLQESLGLAGSILLERWHEHRLRKEGNMNAEEGATTPPGAGGGGYLPAPGLAGARGLLWAAGWALLTTAAIPAGALGAAPFAMLLFWLVNLGAKAGLWPPAAASSLQLPGFIAALSLALGAVQWALLRRRLPRAGGWFLATGLGILLGGLAAGLVFVSAGARSWEPLEILAGLLLPAGLALGLAQWLYLRRFLPHAAWIIPIDVLAAASIIQAGQTITHPLELLVFTLPGLITGLGLWALLNRPGTAASRQVPEAQKREKGRLPLLARLGLAGAALAALFFACTWTYTVSQLALAKSRGVYPSVEEAVIELHSQGFGGARVVRIENVRAGPNWTDARPHVWFGSATVYFDRVPEGLRRDFYNGGSYYIRVREGWVLVPEGSFPEFIGWAMELFNLEGVQQP